MNLQAVQRKISNRKLTQPQQELLTAMYRTRVPVVLWHGSTFLLDGHLLHAERNTVESLVRHGLLRPDTAAVPGCEAYTLTDALKQLVRP